MRTTRSKSIEERTFQLSLEYWWRKEEREAIKFLATPCLLNLINETSVTQFKGLSCKITKKHNCDLIELLVVDVVWTAPRFPRLRFSRSRKLVGGSDDPTKTTWEESPSPSRPWRGRPQRREVEQEKSVAGPSWGRHLFWRSKLILLSRASLTAQWS